MPLEMFKPSTPGVRHATRRSFADITKTEPEKSLIVIKKRTAGRTQGTITVRHRGGGAKRYVRLIDFKRENFDIPGIVQAIEYDPSRGARIALVLYNNKEKRYILAPEGLKAGEAVVSYSSSGEIKTGNALPLGSIPVGMFIHNIELLPGRGGKLARGAGQAAQLLGVEGKLAQIKLPSGEVRMVSAQCRATLGRLSNSEHNLIQWGKAGKTRLRGRRPIVRGKAMNPVDNPHGGGEGRNPIGLRYAKTPWGKHAMGVKTRRVKKWSGRFILQRRKQ